MQSFDVPGRALGTPSLAVRAARGLDSIDPLAIMPRQRGIRKPDRFLGRGGLAYLITTGSSTRAVTDRTADTLTGLAANGSSCATSMVPV